VRHASTAFVCLALAIALLPFHAGAQTLEDKVQEFTLDNGMTFLVVERHNAPVFFGAIAFRVGSIYERPGITGISHLLEHMLFKGTGTVGTTDFEAELAYIEKEDELAGRARDLMEEIEPWRLEFFDEHAAEVLLSFSEEDREAMGADHALELELLIEHLIDEGVTEELASVPGLVEGHGVNYFDLYIDVKRLEMELYDTMAEQRQYIVDSEFSTIYTSNGSRMLNAGTSYDGTFYFVALPSNRLELWMYMESDRLRDPTFREFYLEREVVMEERRMSENTPEDVLFESFMSTAYSACPYKSPILGWMSDIRHINRPDLIDYYRTHYGAQNAVALVIGDVKFKDVKRMAEKYFGDVPRGEDLPYVTSCEPKQQGERRVVVEEDAEPELYIGYHVPKAPHPDSYALDVLSSILSGGRTSRFYRSIYEEQGLTADAPSVWIGPGNQLDPIFVIDAQPKHPHTLEEVEAAIFAELERLKAEPVSTREIERVLNQEEAELTRSLGSNYGIAFRVGFHEALRGDWRLYLEDMERRKQVTREDIVRVAETYFTPENRTVGWLVSRPSEDGTEPREDDEAKMRELMAWVRSLPPEEQQELMNRFMSLDDAGRQALAEELYERMKTEKAGS